jgi:hypothetical protein
VRITRSQRRLPTQGRAEAPKDLLAREGGQSGRDARTADDREKVCTALPSFEEALAGGAVSAGHVDAIASVVRGLDQVDGGGVLRQLRHVVGQGDIAGC